MKTKSWNLTVDNQQLTLSLPTLIERKKCWKCSYRKEIVIISHWESSEIRNFCYICALQNLTKLADYQVSPISVINQVRADLIFGTE